MSVKVNRRLMMALWLLLDGKAWHASALFGVGYKTFGELMDNGLATEPDKRIFNFRITDAGLSPG